MRPIEEIYPQKPETIDHSPMIDSIGTVLVKAINITNPNNGWVLYQDVDLYGYLIYGWDTRFCEIPLVRCKDYPALGTLRTTLKENTKWGTKLELSEFFNTNDWTRDYSYQFQEFRDFIEAAKLALI